MENLMNLEKNEFEGSWGMMGNITKGEKSKATRETLHKWKGTEHGDEGITKRHPLTQQEDYGNKSGTITTNS